MRYLVLALVFVLTTLASVTNGSKITDHVDYTFAVGKLQRTAPRMLQAKVTPHIGDLPPFLEGATLKLKVKYLGKTGLSAHVTMVSPVLGTSGKGWLTGKSIWGAMSGVAKITFEQRGLRCQFFLRGHPSYGFTALGKAKQEFTRPAGVRLVRSKTTVPAGAKALQDALNSNPSGPRLIATIDHGAAAKKVRLALAPSVVVVFGRPQIGAPLWSKQAETGIELPMEVAVMQSPLGVGYVAYNGISAMGKRFGISDIIPPVLPKALANFARIAAGLDALEPEPEGFDVNRVGFLAGIVTKSRSDTTAADAYKRLIDALEAAPPVNIAYAIEHDKSAEETIPVTSENKVAVFGNPAIGTLLMQSSFTAALDLPAKIGVWNLKKGDTRTYVGYVQPDWIADRHMAEKQSKLTGALNMFSDKAIGK